MAQIAEDLFLLLLDNASAQPALERQRLQRVLSAAVLLDLAYACRVRPAITGDPAEPGKLVALTVPAATDPVAEPAFQLLQRRPMRPGLRSRSCPSTSRTDLTHYLEYTGQIRRIRLQANRFTHPYAWPLTNRDRVGDARAALLSALFRPQSSQAGHGGDHFASACGGRARCAAEPQRPRLAVGARSGRRNRQAAVGFTSTRPDCPSSTWR